MQVFEGLERHREEIAAAAAQGRPIWVDLQDPSAQELAQAGELFGIHHLAVEDSREWHQRPKFERYGEQGLVVFYGLTRDHDELPVPAEVHLHVAGERLLTVHRRPIAALDELRAGGADAPEILDVIYRILDALTDSFFPVLDELEDRVDQLEVTLLSTSPPPETRERVLQAKRTLLRIHQRVTAQRDMLPGAMLRLHEDSSLREEDLNRFRDIADHLWLLHGRIETLREQLQGVLELYVAALSNRLNISIKRLTIVATIFLPLTFVTGIFGQNFDWMIKTLDTREAFLFFGLGLPVLASALLLAWMWVTGTLGDDDAPVRRRARRASGERPAAKPGG